MLRGCGYGLCLVSGLLEIQRRANPQDLASLTAIYYALTYVGFAAPIILAELTQLTSAPTVLLATAGLLLLTIATIHRGHFRP